MVNQERILTSVSWENTSWFSAMRATQTENDLLIETEFLLCPAQHCSAAVSVG